MIELNKIHNIDALEGLKQIDSLCVDLYIFSPPYNLRSRPDGKIKPLSGSCGKWKNYKLQNGYENYNDAMPHEDYVKWQHNILNECWRALKETGAIFYNHKPLIRKGTIVCPSQYIPKELNVRQVIIWARSGGLNFNERFYLPTHEYIYLICKPGFALKSRGASGIKDVWNITQEKGSDHPAPFPIEIPNNIIETVKCNNLVVDPFSGSGTSCLSAKRHNCNYIGFEISKEYCELSEKRLALC